MKEETLQRPGIVYDPYDINVIQTIKNLEKSVASKKKILKSDKFDSKEYFDNLWELAKYYYDSLDPKSSWRFNSFEEHLRRQILIVPSDHVFFQVGITLDLIARENYEISEFLYYHAENFIGFEGLKAEHFPVFIEKVVLRNISNWSPFQEDARQELIMRWVHKIKDAKGSDESHKNSEINLWIQINKQFNTNIQTLPKELKDWMNKMDASFQSLKDELSGNKKMKASNTYYQEILTFEDLFKKQEWIKPCVDVLKDPEVDLIKEDWQYLHGPKYAFWIWIHELFKLSFINYINDANKLKLLNKYFPGLDIKDDSLFRKEFINDSIYRRPISRLLLQIKEDQ
jgi:hypothetical protein